ncbi:zinc-ribbon domain-containing protein [Bifidobacterium simiarum]|uniref:zinc-ribbon domain-containing protein n=1 Tax=Bifidobacterium simiarum TaxID=2045441 RepID=UPI001BDD9242|nr:hypothetical protein [Bifidobacterium simiarum]MBT1166466.1 hypothetical protein [Bifidobacterium simiarum]
MEDKYCRFCGALLPEEALFCTKCGKATAVEGSATAESAPDAAAEPMKEPQSSVVEDSAEESDIVPDGEGRQNERDVTDESGHDADEPHWWKRPDDQVIRESEAAQERRVAQQKQKWNRKRIIVITIVALIVVSAIIGAALISRSATQPGKNQETSSGGDSASNCFAISQSKSSGSIYDRSCDSDSENNPSATLRYLFKQLSGKPVSDESVQLGGRNTTTDVVPYVYISSPVGNLQFESGVLWYFGKTIGANPFSYLPPMVSKALGAVGYNESVLGFDGSLDEAGVQKVEAFKKQVPYYRYSVSGYGDVVFGVVAYSVDGGQQFAVDIIVYDGDDLPDWVTNIHDSNQTNQSDSSTSSSNQNAKSNDSSAVDTDFADLWTAVAIKENLSKIAGEYCRNDGSCVMIKANSGHTAGDYSTEPGEIIFTSGGRTFNPLPGQSTELGLSFAFQQQPTTVPDTITPIDMQTMTDGCNAASDASCQAGVTYVMPGAGTSHFTDRVEPGNSPNSDKSYLVIGWQTKVSDDTVFYRK